MSDLANELRKLCDSECRNRIDYRCAACRGADSVARLAEAEEAARWMYGICTGTLTWKDVHTNEHPAIRWPWLEPKSVKVEGGNDAVP